MSNSFVKRGRNFLKNSAIEKKVIELYVTRPSKKNKQLIERGESPTKQVLEGENLDKEILATAIVFEGAV